MRAEEARAEAAPLGFRDDRAFDAADVGEDRVARSLVRDLVKLRDGGDDRRREHDEIGALERRIQVGRAFVDETALARHAEVGLGTADADDVAEYSPRLARSRERRA